MHVIVRGVFLVNLLLVLVACGGADTYSQKAQSAHFSVQMNLDHISSGSNQATIEVWDQQNNAIDVDEVIVAPIMPAMGHASPEVIARKEADGHYAANGSFFFMPGDWEVHIHIRQGVINETLRFIVQVNQNAS